jgi:hypothetical protein
MADSVVEETDRLAWSIVTDGAVREAAAARSQAELCLRQCVGKMLDRHSMVFGGGGAPGILYLYTYVFGVF